MAKRLGVGFGGGHRGLLGVAVTGESIKGQGGLANSPNSVIFMDDLGTNPLTVGVVIHTYPPTN